ncbi:PREDICTED: anaphase-promoting complex subunit 2, partial [Myotis davidii]|uniref:anaphase-promoting complex subunit 2 n=1 Tax=Myotis davidii TaxID=225400 RepID=UPI000766ED29
CADEPQCLLLLLDAFALLESRLDPYLRSLELLEKWTRLGLLMGTGAQGLRDKVHTTLRGVLFFSTPRTFQEMVQRLYGRFLRVYMQSKRKGEGGTDPELEGDLDSRYARRRYYRLLQSPLCAGCGSEKQQCWCRQALEQFHQLSQVLHRLSLLERVSAEAVTVTLHQVTRERMEDRCRGEYERSFLREFHKVMAPGHVPRDRRMGFWQTTCRQNVGTELFSIIRDFPDSRPAVEDLKYCLERTDQRQQLLVSLKAALETRLLHPGVNTCDIITLYISAIKALRVLDPSMVILEVACEPVRRYLRPPFPQDMADSRRINANIREEDEKRPLEEQPPFGVYAVILSSEFWPPFKDEKLEVPEDIREALEVYCRKYEKLKAMRTLSWKHTLGLVTMDLKNSDLKYLSSKILPSPLLRRGPGSRLTHAVPQLFWTYIQAMLTNLESLSLERIYSMLRMFVVTGPALAEIDLQELQAFLQKKVRDQQLVFAAGVYRLPKSWGSVGLGSELQPWTPQPLPGPLPVRSRGQQRASRSEAQRP